MVSVVFVQMEWLYDETYFLKTVDALKNFLVFYDIL